MFSTLAINRNVTLCGADAEELGPLLCEVRRRGRGAAALKSDYGILTSIVGPRGCVRNALAGVGFKCLLAANIGRFEFEPEGKKGVVVNGGPGRILGGIPVSAREVVWGGFSLIP